MKEREEAEVDGHQGAGRITSQSMRPAQRHPVLHSFSLLSGKPIQRT